MSCLQILKDLISTAHMDDGAADILRDILKRTSENAISKASVAQLIDMAQKLVDEQESITGE